MIFALVAFVATAISLALGLCVGVHVLGFTDGFILRSVINTLLLLLAINIVCASFFSWLVPKVVHPFSKLYKVHKWENKLYLRLGVRNWKDKIPELGARLAGFDKSTVGDMHDNEHIKQFITQTIMAEYNHGSGAIFGFFAIFACLKVWHIVGIPLLLANLIINLMPIIVQRYNRPKLMLLYERNAKNQAKQAAKEQE